MKYFSVLFCVPLRVLLLSAILSGVCLSRLRKRRCGLAASVRQSRRWVALLHALDAEGVCPPAGGSTSFEPNSLHSH